MQRECQKLIKRYLKYLPVVIIHFLGITKGRSLKISFEKKKGE
jgi:hypothetical protein